MQIRDATPEDAEALATLAAELGYPVDAGTIVRRLGAIAVRAGGTVLVAVDTDGEVCGFADAEPRHLLISGGFGELAGFVVAESARGQGVGAALLAEVEQWSRRRGFDCVRVRSNVTRERAHRFYLREGYVEKKRQAVFSKRVKSR